MHDHKHATAITKVKPPVHRSDIAVLCQRIHRLLTNHAIDTVACDVQTWTHCDAMGVAALAHMQLTARRAGRSICLHHAPPTLVGILSAIGLSEVLPVCTSSPPDPTPTTRATHDAHQRHPGTRRC